MKSSRITWIAGAALAIGAALPGVASAQSTWNIYNNSTDGCTQNGTNANNFGNSWSCKGVGTAGTTATLSAWSTQNGSGTSAYQATSGSQYANAYLSDQGTSGFGAANRTEGLSVSSPNHAVDNLPTGQYDFVLLNFGTSVILNSVGIGWANGGVADITVMRWTGAGAPTGGTAAVTTGGNGALATSGWTLVGSFSDLTADNTTPFGGTARSTGATQASSWWMISAFNSTLNGGTSCKNSSGTASTCDDGDDAFKLNWVKTSLAGGGGGGTGIPEPASLALVGAALLGLSAARRYGQRA